MSAQPQNRNSSLLTAWLLKKKNKQLTHPSPQKKSHNYINLEKLKLIDWLIGILLGMGMGGKRSER